MKIIFLDIDGVLNSQAYFKSRAEGRTIYVPSDFPYSEIDTESVEYLNNLIERTGAKVVISSTWRHGRTVVELQEILAKRGFKGEVIGKTPDMRDASIFRGNEIHKWIADHSELVGYVSDYRSYVILDDDSDFLYSQRNNFIWIDSAVGITVNTAYKAAMLLNHFDGDKTCL